MTNINYLVDVPVNSILINQNSLFPTDFAAFCFYLYIHFSNSAECKIVLCFLVLLLLISIVAIQVNSYSCRKS